MSALPIFENMKVGDQSLSVFLSKLFNGTWSVEHDDAGAIIKDSVLKLDLRGELGMGIELGRQAIPVVANECIVRTFYFIRRLALDLRSNKYSSLADLDSLDWKNSRLSTIRL